jgi:hypothetical protein
MRTVLSFSVYARPRSLVKGQRHDAAGLCLAADVDGHFRPGRGGMGLDISHCHGFADRRRRRAARHGPDRFAVEDNAAAFAGAARTIQHKTHAPGTPCIIPAAQQSVPTDEVTLVQLNRPAETGLERVDFLR